MDDPTTDKDNPSAGRILTWPNLVSLMRLLLIPVFLYLYYDREALWQAALLLGVIGATDWIDGYLARRLDQVSDLGKILDPTADRLVLLVGVIVTMVDGYVPMWFGAATLVRELLVGCAAITLALAGARRIDVTWWGKSGTFGLMFAYPLFIAANSGIAGEGWFEIAAWLCGIPGLILSYVAAAQYVPIAKEALHDGRASRVATHS